MEAHNLVMHLYAKNICKDFQTESKNTMLWDVALYSPLEVHILLEEHTASIFMVQE
jgi:hypothetical protein